jgi:hypothetical protein
VKTIETTGRANLPGGLSETTSFDLVADNMGTVPVVALGLGSVAGLGAALGATFPASPVLQAARRSPTATKAASRRIPESPA